MVFHRVALLNHNAKNTKNKDYKYIYADNKKGVSCTKQGVSWTKIAFFFKCTQFSSLLLHLVWKAKSLCSNNVRAILRCLGFVFLLCGGSMRRSQHLEIFSVKKKLHKVLHSVQFLASFISFYFEILSYLACGEKIIRPASLTCFRTAFSC